MYHGAKKVLRTKKVSIESTASQPLPSPSQLQPMADSKAGCLLSCFQSWLFAFLFAEPLTNKPKLWKSSLN